MAKFKKGDRVRATVDSPFYKVGQVAIVDEDGSTVPFVKWVGDEIWAVPQTHLELLPVASATSSADKPPFKVGDRVRVTKGDPSYFDVGETGTVSEVVDDGRSCFVEELNADGGWWVDWHALEQVFEQPAPTLESLSVTLVADTTDLEVSLDRVIAKLERIHELKSVLKVAA